MFANPKRRLSTEDAQDSSKRHKLSRSKGFSADEYSVGWICALNSEFAAAKGMLDETHGDLEEQDQLDSNSYILGQIQGHNVVIACCPAGIYGITSAATVAKDMLRTFPSIRIGLMVGIGGAAPSADHDIRLGDVVVSQPYETSGGVIQFDRGRTIYNGDFQRTGALNSPPKALLAALGRLQAEHETSDSKVPLYLSEMLEKFPKMKREYAFQDAVEDCLYQAEYDHPDPNATTCEMCDSQHLVTRRAREDRTPQFHYGIIASSNQVMKHGGTRERLRAELDVLCFEMEAAGLMLDFPCIVVRGISDYSDSHKNMVWQKYAAATAAAFAKELLSFVSVAGVRLEKLIQLVSDPKLHEMVKQHTEKQQSRFESVEQRECRQAFKTSTYEAFKNINPNRVSGTCVWVLEHPKYIQWLDSQKDDLLWISADPGCGKSVLSRSLIEQELRSTDARSVCYFFFKDNEQQDRLEIALCALLHQLLDAQPQLVEHAMSAWKSNGHQLQHEAYTLWRILIDAATDKGSHQVICVLDALDECREEDRSKLLRLLSDFYIKSALQTSRKSTLKFIVTSRPYDHIESGFHDIPPHLPTIRLSGEKENDKIHEEIDLVIRERVALIAETNRLSLSKKEELEQWLLKMEHRTYLWLHLAINGIEKSYRYSWRPDTLSIDSLKLPSSVDDAYEKILSNVEIENKTKAVAILHIIVGARRPLSTSEMGLALGLATQPNARSYAEANIDKDRLEKLIPNLCGLFVFINHSKIYLIHQTAKEFLIYKEGTTDSGCWKHSLMPLDSETIMAQICVSYLLLEELNAIEASWSHHIKNKGLARWEEEDLTLEWFRDLVRENKMPNIMDLMEYSAEHWASHIRHSILTKPNFLPQVLKLYHIQQIGCRLWFHLLWRSLGYSKDTPTISAIQLAAFNGHSDIVKILLDSEDVDIEAKDFDQRSPLFWAVRFGYQEIAEILLDKGADVNKQCGKHGTALQAAIFQGDEAIVRILLEGGADANAQNGKDDIMNHDTALMGASSKGYEAIVKILLDHGADVNVRRRYHNSTALQEAAMEGHEAIVRMLLEKGADINARGGFSNGTALHEAAMQGHKAMVRILLENGADINAQDGPGNTALLGASFKGHEAVVELLLENGTDVTLMQNGEGRWKWDGLGDGKKWIRKMTKLGKEQPEDWDWYDELEDSTYRDSDHDPEESTNG